jgi:hypothetical protein
MKILNKIHTYVCKFIPFHFQSAPFEALSPSGATAVLLSPVLLTRPIRSQSAQQHSPNLGMLQRSVSAAGHGQQKHQAPSDSVIFLFLKRKLSSARGYTFPKISFLHHPGIRADRHSHLRLSKQHTCSSQLTFLTPIAAATSNRRMPPRLEFLLPSGHSTALPALLLLSNCPACRWPSWQKWRLQIRSAIRPKPYLQLMALALFFCTLPGSLLWMGNSVISHSPTPVPVFSFRSTFAPIESFFASNFQLSFHPFSLDFPTYFFLHIFYIY